MKKQILMVFVALLATVPTAFAHDFSAVAPTGQTLYFNITSPNTVEVTSGDLYPEGILEIPSTIEYESTTYSVTSIGSYALCGYSGLTSVTIPNSVTIIGDYAINACRNLESISLGNSVTSIGNYAFGYTNLTSITIPQSVTSIGRHIMAGCHNLTSISVDPWNTHYNSNNNCNAIIQTNNHTLVSGCKTTVIPNSVTAIGNASFVDCKGLTSINIPNSVTSIGDSAFYNCTDLTSVILSNSVTYIGKWAFTYSGLTSVVIPNSVTTIDEYSFGSCWELTSVTFGNSVTSICGDAFHGCIHLLSLTIPNSVTSLNGAFSECYGLTSIIVESDNAVYDSREGCNAIIETSTNTLITGCMNTIIPNSVTSIGNLAFHYCGLSSLTIPNSVTSIGYTAFYRCSRLSSIECLAEIPPTIHGGYSFVEIPTGINLYVPCGMVTEYQAADGWNTFTNIQEVAGCISAGPTDVAIYSEGNDIVVEGAAGNTVTLYDNGGNVLATNTATGGTPLRFESLTSGTYFVKIGVLPARMKVEVR